MEKKEVLLQTTRLHAMLSEISAELVLATESILKSPDSGTIILKGWLTKTVSKLTSAFTQQKPLVYTNLSF